MHRNLAENQKVPRPRVLILGYQSRPYWFFRHLPDLGFDVRVVGAPMPSEVAKRVFVMSLWQVLFTWSKWSSYDFLISLGFARGVLTGFCIRFRRALRLYSPTHVVISIGGVLWPVSLGSITRRLLSTDRVVCFTKAERDGLKARLKLKNVIFVPFGVDTEYWLPAKTHNNYVFSGGMTARDYQTFFEAISPIGFNFIVVASRDPLTNELGFDMERVPPNVQLLMDIPVSEFRRMMSGALLTVIPLKATTHSAGHTVLVQALACGEPVISTKVAGTVDYIIPGKTGLFVSPGNCIQLREEIKNLLADAELREILGKNARIIAIQEFSEKRLAQRFADLLEQSDSKEPKVQKALNEQGVTSRRHPS